MDLPGGRSLNSRGSRSGLRASSSGSAPRSTTTYTRRSRSYCRSRGRSEGEAAAALGRSADLVPHQAQKERLRARKVDGVWIVDADDLERYRREVLGRTYRRGGGVPRPHLPAAPLLRQVELRGGTAACGVRPKTAKENALERARHAVWVRVRA